MSNFLKHIFCKHNYKIITTIKTIYEYNSGTQSNIYTDLLECKNCGKRKILYTYDLLVPSIYRKYFKLWENYQMDIGEFDK